MSLKIENKTPWDTEALTKLLTFLCEKTPVELLKVETLRAKPGVKREDQTLFLIEGVDYYAACGNGQRAPYTGPTKLTVGLISPKRAAARTDLLDRMAQVDDLKAHEIALPESIVGGICHAFGKLKSLCAPNSRRPRGDSWEYRKHYSGECKCSKHLSAYPVIRGNTKTRTAPPVDIAKLKRRGRWALESAEAHRLKMEQNLVKAQKLAERIRKEEAKIWKAKGDNR